MTKTWLITGASSGLGRLLTEKLLTRGDRSATRIARFAWSTASSPRCAAKARSTTCRHSMATAFA